MSFFSARVFRVIDWPTLALTVLLFAIGIMSVYSSTFRNEGVSLLRYQRQLIFIGIGSVLAIVIWFFNYRDLRRFVPWLFLLQLVLLVAVLFFGVEVNGAQAWFRFGTFGLQPVEFVKIITILVLAKYFSEHYTEMHRFRHIVVSGLYVFLPIFLVMLQPDLGSVLVLVAIWIGMLLVANVPYSYLFIVFVAFLIMLLVGWFFVLQGYQKERISCVLENNVSVTTCYNTRQALIAIGSGGLIGKGFGHGSQSQLDFLPEKDTDFIFSVFSEEFGFFGSVMLLVLFGLLLIRLSLLARDIPHGFGKFFLLGVVFMLSSHIFINVGMNLGIVPVVGIPLPFVSAGGSMVLSLMIALGLVFNIIKTERFYKVH